VESLLNVIVINMVCCYTQYVASRCGCCY
jgi:hypothetical protein